MSTPPESAVPDGPAQPQTKEELEARLVTLGEEMNSCLLSEYRGTLVGLGLGVLFSVYRKRGFFPLLVGGGVGSLGDLVYSMGYGCQDKVKAYQRCRDAIAAKDRPPSPFLQPPSSDGGAAAPR